MGRLSSALARVLRCPQCSSPLSAEENRVVCTGSVAHEIEVEEDTLILARPDPGKYDPVYASRYAALWAFGYATLHSGLDEGLYRTVSSFVAEALATCTTARPLIVDAGCGVGRVTGDCGRLAPHADILALDASPPMLAFARRVVLGTEPIEVELPKYGFPRLTIPPYGLTTPVFARADVEHLPLADASVDLVLGVNIVDRLPRGPELAFAECHRVLKPGGTLIFTDPFNWTEPWLWEKYPNATAVLKLLSKSGYSVKSWFDDLLYREIVDGRASTEEFRTTVVSAIKDSYQ